MTYKPSGINLNYFPDNQLTKYSANLLISNSPEHTLVRPLLGSAMITTHFHKRSSMSSKSFLHGVSIEARCADALYSCGKNVCPSVTPCCRIKTTQATITKSWSSVREELCYRDPQSFYRNSKKVTPA